MTTITSAASINAVLETEVSIDTANRNVTLNLAGNLSADGVTLQALYSYLKKAWRVQTFDIGSSGANTGDVINLDNTTNVLPGMAVTLASGTGVIAANTIVVSVDSATAITVTTGNITTPLDGTSEITFTNHLIEYPFPLVAITPEQFEWSFDWTLNSAASRQLIRTAGWKEINTAGTIQSEYVGVLSLGTINGKAITDITATDISFAGAVITSTAENLGIFNVGDYLKVSGSNTSDGTYIVTAKSSDGAGGSADTLTVKDVISDTATSFTTENAGATITINGGHTVYYAFRSSAKATGLVITGGTTITGPAGTFDSFANGDVVTISGATDAGNNDTFVITTASSTALVFPGASLTNNAGDANEITVTAVAYDAKADLTYAGPANEVIQTYDGTTAGDFRSDELALFVREEGKTFGKSDTVSIGITSGSTIGAQTFRFPLGEATDLDYTISDKVILAADGVQEKYDLNDNNAPTIKYYSTDQTSTNFLATDLTTPRNFGVRIDAEHGTTGQGSLTLQEIYSWVKYRLRQNVDIDDEGGTDASPQIGATSDELLRFVGPQLQTLLVQNGDGATTPSGVAIEKFASGDIGNLAFRYTGGGGAFQQFPKVASGTITFNPNLAEDVDATYTMFYQYTREYDVADLSWSRTGGVGTSAGTLASAGNNIPVTSVGDYIDVSGFADVNLNGVYEITTATGTGSIDVTRIDDVAVPASESAQSGGTENFRFNPVNSPDAIIVKDSSGAEIRGAVPQVGGGVGSSVTFDYGYTNDTTPDQKASEDRVADAVVNVEIRASGTTRAQFVITPGTIGTGVGVPGTANNFSVVAPLERNYAA